MNRTRITLRREVPLIVILAAAVAGLLLLRPWLSYETLVENRKALMEFCMAHYAWSAVVFIAGYVLVAGLSLPGATVMTLAGGFMFGLIPGALYSVAGATAGALVIFLAVRMGLGEGLAARIDAGRGPVHRLKAGIDANQVSVLLVMRLVPAVPFFVANVVAALMAVPARRFLWTTALGIVPGALVYTSAGAGLGDLIAADIRPGPAMLLAPHILLPMLGLAGLAALPMLLRLARPGTSA